MNQLGAQYHPVVTYKKIDPPQSVKHVQKYMSPAFNYDHRIRDEDDDQYDESDISANRIHAIDLDKSHLEKSEKLKVMNLGGSGIYHRHDRLR